MAKARNRIRSNDPIGLRARLLDAAAAAFQTSGYAATSIHDLLRATGVTGGALHHHFPSKKSLVLAVIDERVAAEIAATWLEKIEAAPTAAEGILGIFAATRAGLDGQGSVRGCPLGNLASELSTGDDEMRAAIARHYGQWRDAMAAKIGADQSAGKAAYAAKPIDFANFVIALFTGALTVGKAEQSTSALRAAEQQLRRLMSADLQS